MNESTYCPYCGVAVDSSFAFCDNCGERLPPPEPEQAAQPAPAPPTPVLPLREATSWPEESSRPAERRQLAPLFLALAGLLALALVVGGGFLLLNLRDRGDGSAPTAEDTAVPPASEDTTESSEEPAEESSHTSSPPAADPFLCWNGVGAARLADCPDPTAAASSGSPFAGMNWVFVDRQSRVRSQAARCHDIRSTRNRVLHRSCRMTFDGAEVCVNWSQWESSTAARQDYDHLGYPRSQPRPGGGTELIWAPSTLSSHCADLTYKTAAMIQGRVWGVTAYADDSATAIQVREYFGEFRRVDHWRGVPQ